MVVIDLLWIDWFASKTRYIVGQLCIVHLCIQVIFKQFEMCDVCLNICLIARNTFDSFFQLRPATDQSTAQVFPSMELRHLFHQWSARSSVDTSWSSCIFSRPSSFLRPVNTDCSPEMITDFTEMLIRQPLSPCDVC